ncbi:autotransporter outer membrane beta-barrel domain-containing protein [Pseudomonas alliivorans]|nr:autotransporter outer membrane beta-barrel domain-containing protein [Pseudomonas alliivorans]
MAERGSYSKLDNSEVEASGMALSVTNGSSMDIENTRVTAMTTHFAWAGTGVGIFGSQANVSHQSYIKGLTNGIWITDSQIEENGTRFDLGRLTVDSSTVEGVNGAAIKVEGLAGIPHFAEINILNRAALISGNGNLVESVINSTSTLNVDDSVLYGNLFADDTSTLNVTLQNRASLTGDIINGNTLAVKSGGNWQMVGDNAMRSLSMDGGSVNFAEEGFHTLSLNELSGQGSFGMQVNLDKGVGDLIDVNGQASGQFGLRVRNTGLEVVSSDMEPLKVVHTEGGDAQFSLLGGRVDLGAFSYQLKQQGNDWFIAGEDKVISPSTQSALALFNAAPTVWMSELSTLRTRMGEIRGTGQGGSWMRAYGSRLNATTGDGVDYRQQISGLSLGADAPVEVSNGQLLFGVLGGYSKSDLDLSHGTSGKIDSYYAGAYGTWLADDGYYLDGVLKLNRFRNKAKVAMSDASQAKGDYSNTAVGGWVEFGRHIKLADDYFLEPFAQLSSVVVEGKNYRMDNGLKAKNDRTHSLLGKVGTSAGRSIALKDGGVLQPYVRVALAQEFSRSNDVSVNDAKFDNSLFGSRAELGAGVSVSLSERLQVHADFDYMKGRHVEQPWGANVGVRLAF